MKTTCPIKRGSAVCFTYEGKRRFARVLGVQNGPSGPFFEAYDIRKAAHRRFTIAKMTFVKIAKKG